MCKEVKGIRRGKEKDLESTKTSCPVLKTSENMRYWLIQDGALFLFAFR